MNLELKIPPPIVALVCVAGMWGLSSKFPELDFDFFNRRLVATLIMFTGLGIDFLALAKFKQKQTTINPMKPEQSSELVVTGIYKFTRNPMYLGLLFILSACAMFFSNIATIIMLLVFVGYITKFQIIPEERIMQEKFKQSYEEYKLKVRRWI